MKKIIEFLKKIFTKPEDKVSTSWIKEHTSSNKEEFHGVCWNFPVIKDF